MCTGCVQIEDTIYMMYDGTWCTLKCAYNLWLDLKYLHCTHPHITMLLQIHTFLLFYVLSCCSHWAQAGKIKLCCTHWVWTEAEMAARYSEVPVLRCEVMVVKVQVFHNDLGLHFNFFTFLRWYLAPGSIQVFILFGFHFVYQYFNVLPSFKAPWWTYMYSPPPAFPFPFLVFLLLIALFPFLISPPFLL